MTLILFSDRTRSCALNLYRWFGKEPLTDRAISSLTSPELCLHLPCSRGDAPCGFATLVCWAVSVFFTQPSLIDCWVIAVWGCLTDGVLSPVSVPLHLRVIILVAYSLQLHGPATFVTSPLHHQFCAHCSVGFVFFVAQVLPNPLT